MPPQASDADILAAITKAFTGVITFDVDKAAALINVTRKTLENRLAGIKREYKISVKATSGIRKATTRQRKAEPSPTKQQERKDETAQKLLDLSSVIDAGEADQSENSAEL